MRSLKFRQATPLKCITFLSFIIQLQYRHMDDITVLSENDFLMILIISGLFIMFIMYMQMLIMRIQVKPKPACSATDASLALGLFSAQSIHIM